MKILIVAILVAALVSASAFAVEEPAAIMGAGTTECSDFVKMRTENKTIESMVLSWVQGWFSARNVPGVKSKDLHTVGGSLSHETLLDFVVSECVKHPNEQIVFAADVVYDLLASKGL